MTLLAILANHAVALPLAGSFPAGELQYILEQSRAALLLSSHKMQGKADEVMQRQFESKPAVGKVDQIRPGSGSTSSAPSLEDCREDGGGLMLYTSGTTSRPVHHGRTLP